MTGVGLPHERAGASIRGVKRPRWAERLRSSGPWVFFWLLVLVALIGVIVIVTGHDSKCQHGAPTPRSSGYCLDPPNH